jgi:uncharacterized protein (TIGR04255 family)
MSAPLTLPDPKPVVFGKSPLSLVVCQLRFEDLGEVERHFDVLRELLAERYPLSQKMQSTGIQIGPGGAQAMPSASGLRFSSVDGKWTLTLMPDFCSLETTDYNDWADFDERLADVLQALEATAKPRVETRLGLRYVNQLQVEGVREASDWTEYLHPAIVGELDESIPFAASTLTLHQLIQLDVGEEAQMTFRHGLPGAAAGLEDGSLAYVLDFDCFRQSEPPRSFDIDDVRREADRFNTLITSLFQWCLKKPLWEELESSAK